MTTAFWVKGECVLSMESVAFPRIGDRIHLDTPECEGYFRVVEAVWSHRRITTQITGKTLMSDDRLEVHLARESK